MKRFYFYREEDETGISGTGFVAEGVVLTGGRTIVNWLTKYPTTSTYDRFEDAEFLHGHDGKTLVVWIDNDSEKVSLFNAQSIVLSWKKDREEENAGIQVGF